MKPGRKSSFDNIIPIDVKSTRSKLTAPSFLTKVEASTFAELASLNRHLTATDALMLGCYTQAVSKTAKLAKAPDVQSWERACRVMLALARSLRLTPQSTVDPQSLGRRRQELPLSYYDTMHDDADED